jgi:hypothetical protein
MNRRMAVEEQPGFARSQRARSIISQNFGLS